MDPADDVPTRAYRPVAVFAGIVGFAVLCAVMWHSTKAAGWERPLMRAFERRPLPLRDFWVAMFDPIPFALTTLAVASIAAARGRERLALFGFAGCMGAVVTAELLFKPFVDRARLHVEGGRLVRFGGPIFPSAHVTAAAACATFAWFVLGRRTSLIPLLVGATLVIGHSVISRKMHYPGDVVGGMLLGWTWVYGTVGVTRAAMPQRERTDTAAPPPHADTGAPV